MTHTSPSEVTAAMEEDYLSLIGQSSIAVAFILFFTALSNANIGQGTAWEWVLGGGTLVALTAVITLCIRSFKYTRNLNRVGFWTLKFNDEYVDFVSGTSLRITCHIMMYGGIIIGFFGSDMWFQALVSPLPLNTVVQLLVSVAFSVHGGIIVAKLREEDLNE